MLKKRKFSLFFLVFILVITYLSLVSLPDLGGDLWFDHQDKLIHFMVYVILSVVSFLALMERTKNVLKKSTALKYVLVFAICYGLLIEVLQYAMPLNRMFEVLDILANLCGALLGCWLIQKYGSLISYIK